MVLTPYVQGRNSSSPNHTAAHCPVENIPREDNSSVLNHIQTSSVCQIFMEKGKEQEGPRFRTGPGQQGLKTLLHGKGRSFWSQGNLGGGRIKGSAQGHRSAERGGPHGKGNSPQNMEFQVRGQAGWQPVLRDTTWFLHRIGTSEAGKRGGSSVWPGRTSLQE